MRYYRKALVCATWLAIAAAGSAAAQESPMPGIFGIYNPSTGQFQPTPVQMAASPKTTDAPFATVSRSGKFVIKFSIAVQSGSPPTTMPTCYVNIYHSPSGHSYSESNSLTGTRTNNHAACTVVVPYSWTEADSVIPVTMSITVYVGNRNSGKSLAPISLPANGATTTIVIPVVL